MKIVVSFLMSAAVSFSAFAETKNPSGDVPRYAWRGYMLDCSRHFFAVREIKKTLEAMHAFGLNVFHWHLTDDAGWRVPRSEAPSAHTERIGHCEQSPYERRRKGLPLSVG